VRVGVTVGAMLGVGVGVGVAAVQTGPVIWPAPGSHAPPADV
jgi:hypothetical protein